MAGWTVVPNPDTAAWKPVADVQARPAGLPAGMELPQSIAAPVPNALKPGSSTTRIGQLIDEASVPVHSSNPILNQAAKFGAGVIGNSANVLNHPIDTVKSLVKSSNPFDVSDLPNSEFGPVISAVKNPAQTLGGLVGGTLLGEGIGGAIRSAAPLVQRVGAGAQDAGVSRMNTTVGALKADFKRGANPGQAYFDAGGGPAMSMQALADKGLAAKAGIGTKIGDLRDSATQAGVKLPAATVAGALNPAIIRGIDLETGAGGVGNTAPIENYSASLRPAIKAALANGGFSPNDLADLKTRIAQNTNWSEPSQFNLKAIRQQNTGAISGLESDAIPELQPLKSQYQGLRKFADRAQSRAETGSSPLTNLVGKTAMSGTGALIGGMTGLETGHAPLMAVGGGLAGLAAESVPVQTGLASGLYYGGRGLTRLGGGLRRFPPPFAPSAAIAAYNLNKDKDR